MYNIHTDIGKIFCKYNKMTDDFDKIRLVKVVKKDSGECNYIMMELDEASHISFKTYIFDEEKFKKIKKEYTVLASEGVISITNIVALENDLRQIKDVLAIYFPNNKVTKVPDSAQPYIVARQGINNIFAAMAGEERVGMSVSLETIPDGYTLTDLMENTRVLNSHLTHVYRTDNAEQIAKITENSDTSEILGDLFQHEYDYLKNTNPNFEDFKVDKKSCLKGYCIDISTFLEESDFMNELFNKMNIIRVDFPMETGVELDIDQKAMCSVLLGGARINKSVPIMFDYTINMMAVKMKYFLAEDSNNNLFIVPYTESPAEVDPKVLYDLTEERTNTLQERLIKVVRAYDKNSVKMP